MDWLSLINEANEYAGLIGAGTGVVGSGVALANLHKIRRDSDSRTRPYVFVEPVPGLHGEGTWDLLIKNMGASIANEIHLSVSPDWDPVDDADKHTPAIKEVLKDPLTLPPGSNLRIMWRYDRPGDDGERDQAGAPEVTRIAVAYKGTLGRKSRKKGYSEEFQVRTDLGIAVPVPTTGSKLIGDERGKELRNIYRALEALNIHVGELRR